MRPSQTNDRQQAPLFQRLFVSSKPWREMTCPGKPILSPGSSPIVKNRPAAIHIPDRMSSSKLERSRTLFEMSSSRARGLGYFTALGSTSELSRGGSCTAGFDTGGSSGQPGSSRIMAWVASFWRCELICMKQHGVSRYVFASRPRQPQKRTYNMYIVESTLASEGQVDKQSYLTRRFLDCV